VGAADAAGPPQFRPRPRRACLGELVQLDGSEHAWFEDRGPACTLLVYVDDATSRLMELCFVDVESTFDYFRATRRYLDGTANRWPSTVTASVSFTSRPATAPRAGPGSRSSAAPSATSAVYLLAGSLFYLIGTLLVTMRFNVPLNDALAAVDPASAEGARLWAGYLTRWTAWNHVRYAAALAGAASLTMALHSPRVM
jgi:hypothetical protein